MTKDAFLQSVKIIASIGGEIEKAKAEAEASAVFDAEFSRLAIKMTEASEVLTDYCRSRLEQKEKI